MRIQGNLMLKNQIKLLGNLIRIPSPSGFEEDIAEFIKQELLQYLPRTRVRIDSFNNVTATIKGTSNQVVMIDAHTDQIGFMVTNIGNAGAMDGIISIGQIGGADSSILSARHLVILTDRGKVNAVVNRRHAHLVTNEEDETIRFIEQAIVDIGLRGYRKVNAVVKIGDPAIYHPSFSQLRASYYSGCGFDDATGCFILIETIKEIVKSKTKPIPTLIFTFSAQEETWGKKCRPLVKKYKPDLFIEVDVTFSSDWSDDEVDERVAGRCDLGKGIVLYRGLEIDKACFKLIRSTAKRHKIKVQYQASLGQIGYTATEITHEEVGIKALILGIPLRNMHTEVEVVNLNDLGYGIQLLTSFLLHRRIEGVLER